MPAGLAIGAGLAPILGGIIGNIASSSDRDKAQQAAQDALNTIQAIGAPPDIAKQIILQKFQQVGVLTPQLEQNVNLGVSKVAGIQEDPGLKAAQMGALQQLQQRGQTGLGPEDIAALAKIRQGINAQTQGATQQILQNMQARGQAGSGTELAALLSNAQAGTQRESDADIQQSGLASQRALQAMIASGQLGGQVRAQDFDINQAKAQAADAVNRFNVQNQIANQMRNIQSQNQAQQYNIGTAQQLSNANVQAANQEAVRQQQAAQQQWQDQFARQQAIANAQAARSQGLYGQAAQTGQQWSGIGAGVGAGLGAGANYLGQQGIANAISGLKQQPGQMQQPTMGQLPAPSSSVTVTPTSFTGTQEKQLPAQNYPDPYNNPYSQIG